MKPQLPQHYVWFFLRLVMGWTFLWGFLDKLFGLGRTTAPDTSWFSGASPTDGFLANATSGPFADVYHQLVGNSVVEWLFMIGLLCLGVSLILGIGLRLTALFGSLLMLLMWSAVLPPEHNPVVDEHIVYMLVLIGLAFNRAGHVWGLGTWCADTALVKKYPFLE